MDSLIFDKSGLLRSGWRAGVFLVAFSFVALLLGTFSQMVIATLQIETAPGSATSLLSNAVLSLIPAVMIGWASGKLFERLPFRALGVAFTDGWIKHFGIGLTLGAATLAFAVLIASIFGGVRFALNDSDGAAAIAASIGLSFLIFAVASAFEEALFRGYILQTFARSGLAWLAILLTSVFFGAVHLGNPNANLISTLNTILAGVWFGVAYLKTRDLWFVWGLHLMWNWMQGSIFGIEVSGLTEITTSPLLREIDSGPTWLTGETYGLEGGIVCTIAIALSIAAIHFLPGLTPDNELVEMTTEH